MSEVLSDIERVRNERAIQEEERLLREIEESFCGSADCEILETTVEHLGRKLRQA